MTSTTPVHIVASDAGGTMTDMIIVDTEGRFSIGKASTTPEDQSLGFWDALADAFEGWGVDLEREAARLLPRVEVAVYSGTSMLNVLLTGTGARVGAVVPRGDEDAAQHGRSRQAYAGYAYQDVLHHVTHQHPPPLVPRRLVRGVTGRIDMFGQEAIPLYEHEARAAIAELLDERVEAIAVCLWFSYLNPAHELAVARIADDVMREKGRRVPVHLSHQVAPIMREHSRLNSVVLQAYTADRGREQLERIERRLHAGGYRHPLQVVLAHGGLSNIRYPRLYEASVSTPVGGLLGARYLARALGEPNWVCSDMGGTSFDVGLLMGGEPVMQREVVLARRFFNLPTLVMDSIGAGTGQYVAIDPLTQRVAIGPESAGADPGPVAYAAGNDVPTVMDCALVLGILNPDNYLGGKLKLRTDLALAAIEERCARRLGVDPYDFAEGVCRLINSTMREHIRSVLSARGFSPADYCLLSYGGAGPMHLAGYAAGLPFKGVATVPWAAGFSSFGCAAADITHRYQASTTIALSHGASPEMKMMMAWFLNTGWDQLERRADADLAAEGLPRDQARFQQIAYVRYGGQLEDIEVSSPVARIESPDDMDRLIAAFEERYGQIYAGVARYPAAGYQIFELGLTSTVPKVKPELVRQPLEGPTPAAAARKGERQVYVGGRWQRAALYDMDALRPGNRIDGLSVVEAPATTLFVPPGHRVRMDEWSILWLDGADGEAANGNR